MKTKKQFTVILIIAALVLSFVGGALTRAVFADGEIAPPIESEPAGSEDPSGSESQTETVPETEPSVEPTTESETEPQPIKYSIEITQDDLWANEKLISIYLEDDDKKRQVYSAEPGTHLVVEFEDYDFTDNMSVMAITELRNGESKVRDYFRMSVDQRYLYLVMPDYDVVYEVVVDIDPEKEAASRSEEEASRASASAEQKSIEESIEAEKKFEYGDYVINTDVALIVPPSGFIRANDTMNFDRTVGSFYSTAYRLFVYYAEKDGKYGFYVNDPINKNLIPFVTFAGSGNRNFVVTAAESARSIPGVFREEIELTLTFVEGSSAKVPGYLVIDDEGNSIRLIHLNSNLAEAGFFVYNDDNGVVQLIEYEKYADKDQDKNADEPFTVEPSTEKAGKEGLPRTAVWLIIIGVIVLLLGAAIVAVTIMSRRQEEEEEEIDDEEDENPFDEEDEEDSVEEFDLSPYSAPADAAEEKNDFDFDFGNVLPDEVKPDDMKPEATGEPSSPGGESKGKPIKEE